MPNCVEDSLQRCGVLKRSELPNTLIAEITCCSKFRLQSILWQSPDS